MTEPYRAGPYAPAPAVDIHIHPHGSGLHYLEPSWSESVGPETLPAVLARNLRAGAWYAGDGVVREVIESMDDYLLIRLVEQILHDEQGNLLRHSKCVQMGNGRDHVRVMFRPRLS